MDGITYVPWMLLILVSRPTFFTMEGSDGKFAKVTVPTLDAFLKARSQSVSGNKQELVARAVGCTFLFLFMAMFYSSFCATYGSIVILLIIN